MSHIRQKSWRSSFPTKVTVLEVKEEVGLGPTANIVLIDGLLKVGDQIVMAKKDDATLTRV